MSSTTNSIAASSAHSTASTKTHSSVCGGVPGYSHSNATFFAKPWSKYEPSLRNDDPMLRNIPFRDVHLKGSSNTTEVTVFKEGFSGTDFAGYGLATTEPSSGFDCMSRMVPFGRKPIMTEDRATHLYDKKIQDNHDKPDFLIIDDYSRLSPDNAPEGCPEGYQAYRANFLTEVYTTEADTGPNQSHRHGQAPSTDSQMGGV